jgi:hypothetical protein
LLLSEPEAGHAQPAHYLAINEEKKEIIISIRGTKDTSDVLTDCMIEGLTWPPKLTVSMFCYAERVNSMRFY